MKHFNIIINFIGLLYLAQVGFTLFNHNFRRNEYKFELLESENCIPENFAYDIKSLAEWVDFN